MNSETNPYPSLQNCPVADSTEGTKDSTDTVVSVKPAEPAQYEVCKDSSNLVRVSIPVIGEHTVQLNESNITRFNGMRRIWIEGPFKAENEIRIYQGDKLVFRTRFQNPI